MQGSVHIGFSEDYYMSRNVYICEHPGKEERTMKIDGLNIFFLICVCYVASTKVQAVEQLETQSVFLVFFYQNVL